MYIIGITGGTGSGKTIALHALEKQGTIALDCDEIYHELLDKNNDMKAEIEAHFNGILINGAIDRKQLSELVFNDKSALEKLNKITHKHVVDEVKRRLADWEKQGGTVAVIDAIALFESGVNELCNITVGIVAPVETRIKRIMKRDNITREQAERRINAQKSDSFYIDNCDKVLENNYNTTEEFREKCVKMAEKALNGILN